MADNLSPLVNLDLINQIYKTINAQITERVYNPQYYTSATLGTSSYKYVSAYISGNTSTGTLNDLTLSKASTGFTISGGTTSKTLTVANTVTINSPLTVQADTSITGSLTVSAATNIIKSLTVGATATYTGAVTIRSAGSSNTTITGPNGGTATLIAGTYTNSATTSNSDTPTAGSLLKIGTVDAKKFLAGPASSSGTASYRTIVASDLPVASASADGIVTTGAQAFAGTKTFNDTITTRTNTGPALNLRNESSYMSTINYDTSGNEALAINLKNTATSFMVNHGVDGSQWTTSDKWPFVVPTLQAKNKCVYINELIPNNVSPSYNLKVNGTAYFSDKVYVGNSSTYISYNSSTESLDFVFA